MSRPIILSDCGGANARMGYVVPGRGMTKDVSMPNYIAKSSKAKYVGDRIHECDKLVGLFYQHPIERGYLADLNTQQDIWARAFDPNHINVQPSDCDFAMTMTPLTPREIVKATCELIFEEFNCNSLFITPATTMGMFNFKYDNPQTPLSQSSCTLCVDSGYSHTHIVPYFDNYIINYAMKRVDVGGKFLTNTLKEMVSVRHWNMMEETYLINHVKEQLCYVASDFAKELKKSADVDSLYREFVLPNYATDKIGHVKAVGEVLEQDDQALALNNERFSVPELLFSPPPELRQAGIAETIVQSINLCPRDMHASLYGNILLMGGNTKIPGYTERLTADVRSLAPDHMPVVVSVSDDPIMSPLKGMEQFCSSEFYDSFTLKREEFNEGNGIDKLLGVCT